MKLFLQALLARLDRMSAPAPADRARTAQPLPVRSGWPPLSTTPLLRRRSTDAQPWFPRGPRDDWKR